MCKLHFVARYVVMTFLASSLVGGQGLHKKDFSLVRHYRVGETFGYQMKANNENRGRTTSYQAQANGVVRRNSAGVYFVEFTWSGLSYNGNPVPLPSADMSIEQQLSLDPRFKLSIPDLSKVPPALIAPMLDLLTFYADVQLGMQQRTLHRAGDHVYVIHSRPNSWADHVHTLVGEDAVDFDIALASIDATENTATLVVKHVPPPEPKVSLPVAWMRAPVMDTANNWIQVVKKGSEYLAGVGKEVFTDHIVLNLKSGMIDSATMDNPVDVLEKQCADESLQNCSGAHRYQIHRHIEIGLLP